MAKIKKFNFPTVGEINRKSKTKKARKRALLNLVEHHLMEIAPIRKRVVAVINLGESCKDESLLSQGHELALLFEETGRWKAAASIGVNDGGRPVYLFLTPK